MKPKNKSTMVRWEEQIEKVLDRPVAEHSFQMGEMILTSEPSIRRKRIMAKSTATT